MIEISGGSISFGPTPPDGRPPTAADLDDFRPLPGVKAVEWIREHAAEPLTPWQEDVARRVFTARYPLTLTPRGRRNGVAIARALIGDPVALNPHLVVTITPNVSAVQEALREALRRVADAYAALPPQMRAAAEAFARLDRARRRCPSGGEAGPPAADRAAADRAGDAAPRPPRRPPSAPRRSPGGGPMTEITATVRVFDLGVWQPDDPAAAETLIRRIAIEGRAGRDPKPKVSLWGGRRVLTATIRGQEIDVEPGEHVVRVVLPGGVQYGALSVDGLDLFRPRCDESITGNVNDDCARPRGHEGSHRTEDGRGFIR